MDDRRREIEAPPEESVRWIWEHPKYQNWLIAPSGSDLNVLWIRGKAGSGKSTLAKAIQQRISAEASRKDMKPAQRSETISQQDVESLVVLDHFYSSRKGAVGTDHLIMLRSVLYQLLVGNPELFTYIQEYFQERNPLQPWDFDNFNESLETLHEVLLRVASHISSVGPTICAIVDAMDESDPESAQENLLRETILRMILRISRMENLKFKWIVLSRPANDITRCFSDVNTIIMETGNISAIKIILSQHLDLIRSDMASANFAKLKKSTGNEKIAATASTSPPASSSLQIKICREIEDYILKKADGVVLWTDLILKEIRICIKGWNYSLERIRDKLHSLPPKLEELYEHIVARLSKAPDEYRLSTARAMLYWACFSDPPLTVREFRDAIATATATESGESAPLNLDDRRIIVPGESWIPVQLEISDICGGLVEVAKVADRDSADQDSADQDSDDQDSDLISDSFVSPNDTVQLLHQTAKDFLLAGRGAGNLVLQEFDARQAIRLQCARYAQDFFRPQVTDQNLLDTQHLREPVSSWKVEDYAYFVRRLDDRPLLFYILQFHLNIIDDRWDDLDVIEGRVDSYVLPFTRRSLSPLRRALLWVAHGDPGLHGEPWYGSWRRGCYTVARDEGLNNIVNFFKLGRILIISSRIVIFGRHQYKFDSKAERNAWIEKVSMPRDERDSYE
jgi:hypothetical protein